jgi:NADH-quinone oxidoreductase subunit N
MDLAAFSNLQSLSSFLPELCLGLASMVVLMFPIIPPLARIPRAAGAFTLASLVLVLFLVLGSAPTQDSYFFGMIAVDGLAKFFKLFFLVSTLGVVLMVEFGREIPFSRKAEFYCVLFGILLGMFVTAAATDLVMMYLGIELLSLGSYAIVGFTRDEKRGDEAAIKYIIYGGLSTGAMLYGMSYLYGLAGTTSLVGIAEVLAGGTGSPIAFFVSFFLILAGLGYKIASVPFHFWAPDVYQGAASAVTAFLSVASKGAGFAAFLRVYYTAFLHSGEGGSWAPILDLDWQVFLSLVAMVTMTFGNLGAFRQDNLKRLFAYSSIAHAGYILVGVLALTTAGVQSVLFYLLTYLFTNLAAFTVIVVMADWNKIEDLEGYRDLGRRAPWLALCMAVSLFSLIGVPPMAGFLGKWFLFAAALENSNPWCTAAVIVGLLNSVISVYYYFRVLKVMYLERVEGEPAPVVLHPVMAGLVSVMAIPVVGLFLFTNPLYAWTGSLTAIFLG